MNPPHPNVYAGNMVERLQQNPDEPFSVEDDSEAKTLLFELGLIDKFSKAVPGVPAATEAVTGDCPSHYVLAVLFSGRTKSEDNGYLVYCFPKSRCSAAEATRLMDEILNRPAMGKPFIVKPFSKTSSAN